MEFDRNERTMCVEFRGGRRFHTAGVDAERFAELGNFETRDDVFLLRFADEFQWEEM